MSSPLPPSFLRRSCFYCLVLTPVTFALPVGAQADNTAPVTAAGRQALVQIYAGRDAAMSRKDVTAVTASFAPDFVFITDKNERNDAAQYRKDLADGLKRAQSITVKSTLQSVTPAPGGRLIAQVAQHTEALGSYRLLFIRKTARFTSDVVKRETWGLTRSGWSLHRMQVVTEHQNLKL